MPNGRKGLGYEHQVAMITILPLEALPKLKNKAREMATEEDSKTVESAQAPLTFEEGGQTIQDEFQEINLGSDEES